ncbi:MAG: hypothetical protein ACK56D_04430 [Planctomycetota bacterium]|jgi:hypothetical protein
MVDQVEPSLTRVLNEYGEDIIKDHRRLEALLRDYCPRFPREVFVVAQFARFTEDLRTALANDLEKAAQNVTRLTGIEVSITRNAGFIWKKTLKLVSSQDLLISLTCPSCSNPGKLPTSSGPSKYICPRCHSIIGIEGGASRLLFKKQKSALNTILDWTLVLDDGNDWDLFQYGQYISHILNDVRLNEEERASRLQMPVLLAGLEEYSCQFLKQYCKFPKVKLHRFAEAMAAAFGDYIEIENGQIDKSLDSSLVKTALPRETSEVVAGLINLNQFCDEPKGIVFTDKGLHFCNCLSNSSGAKFVDWEEVTKCNFASRTAGLIDFGYRDAVLDLRGSGIATSRFILFLQVLQKGLSVAISQETPQIPHETSLKP